MIITEIYRVDVDLYRAPNVKHNVSLTTTEHVYRSEILVHLKIGKSLGIRLNGCLRYELEDGAALASEQFMLGNIYARRRVKPITRSTFNGKLGRFDKSQTVVEREVLEEYAYSDRHGHSDAVQIVVTVKGSIMTAVIDFRDAEQQKNFVAPEWLVRLP